jgi:hypothetical protein
MRKIYSQAQHVISWFGDDSRTARLLRTVRETHLVGIIPSTRTQSFNDTLWLKNHRYWTRAWITQEVCLAKSLLLLAKRDLVTLDVLQELGDNIEKQHGHTIYRSFWGPMHDIRENSNTRSLLENLWRFRDKRCKDQRDLVYCLLDMSGIDEKNRFPVD